MENDTLVMIVEDQKVQAYLVAQILSANNYRVACAANGLEALRLIQAGIVPNILVTDIKMPTLNGFELIQELNRLEIKIPTIITSGCSLSSDFENAYFQGVENYLVKPFSPSNLLRRIDKICSTNSSPR